MKSVDRMKNASKYLMIIIISFMMTKFLQTLKRYDENVFLFIKMFTFKKRKTVHSRLTIFVSFGSKCYLLWYLKSNRLFLFKIKKVQSIISFKKLSTNQNRRIDLTVYVTHKLFRLLFFSYSMLQDKSVLLPSLFVFAILILYCNAT